MKTAKIKLLYTLGVSLIIACNNPEKPETFYPSDQAADPGAVKLYTTLERNLDKGIMLGHQDALAYGNNWFGEQGRSDVKSVCGDYPAVFGWELGNIEKNMQLNIDSVSFSSIKSYVLEVGRLGGISTFSWHMTNPVTGKNAGDCSQANVVAAILNDKTVQDRYLGFLDKVADFFFTLKDESGKFIPVIFRPFHEHNISRAFWWNTDQCSDQDFKKLWIMTVDYLRKKKNIHHVLYTYSVYSEEEMDAFTDCYPGNGYVDIIGLSSHLFQENDLDGRTFVQTLNRNLAVLTHFAEKNNKIPAITNTGLEGIKISNFFSEYIYPVLSQYRLSYVLFWRNAWDQEKYYFIPVPGHPASEDFIRFVNQPDILTCKKLG